MAKIKEDTRPLGAKHSWASSYGTHLAGQAAIDGADHAAITMEEQVGRRPTAPAWFHWNSESGSTSSGSSSMPRSGMATSRRSSAKRNGWSPPGWRWTGLRRPLVRPCCRPRCGRLPWRMAPWRR